MKTFLFYHKNTSAVLTLSANDFDEAQIELAESVLNPSHWRCDDEEGEEE